MVKGSDAARRIDSFVFSFHSSNLYDDVTCIIHHRASASLEARLKNPTVTCFQTKQAVRF
jgi:hypothetical protein